MFHNKDFLNRINTDKIYKKSNDSQNVKSIWGELKGYY